MTVQIIDETKKNARSFTVNQDDDDFFTIKKIKKHTEYEVEVLVFPKENIDELMRIQAEIYSEMVVDNISIKERLKKFIHRLCEK